MRVTILSGIVGLAGCAQNKMAYSSAPSGPRLARERSPAEAAGVSSPSFTARSEVDLFGRTQLTAGEAAVPADVRRMLTYSANLAIGVAAVESSLVAVQQIAEKAGGYMQTLTSTSITIRVPAKEFFPILQQLQELGRVINKNIRAEDVTDEYFDLQLRLKNATAIIERLQAMLAKAENVKDTLEIEKELNRVREEIERMKGRIALLDKLVALSTIEVAFVQAQEHVVTRSLPEIPFPWVNDLSIESVLRMGQ
jgi:hypothetical protein